MAPAPFYRAKFSVGGFMRFMHFMRLSLAVVMFCTAAVFAPPLQASSPLSQDPQAASQVKDAPILYIYNWADYLPKDVLEDFQKETHIQVVYDAFDSVEALETKIFTNPGYDVIFPPAWPLFARCVTSGLFIALDYSLLPNARHLDAGLLAKLEECNPQGAYGVPYLWGTTGIGLNMAMMENLPSKAGDPRLPPSQNLATWGLFFDPCLAAVVAPLRIFLLDAALDVFQAAMLYLGYDPTTHDVALWDKAIALVQDIRPFIHTFTASRQKENLLDGKSGVMQGFSSYITMACQERDVHLPLEKRSLRYYIPQEGAMVWFDMMAIPKGAQHVHNAHIFINFILRPDIIARISNAVCAVNAVPASGKWLNQTLLHITAYMSSPQVQNRLHKDFVPPAPLLKYLSRAWLKIKIGYKEKKS